MSKTVVAALRVRYAFRMATRPPEELKAREVDAVATRPSEAILPDRSTPRQNQVRAPSRLINWPYCVAAQMWSQEQSILPLSSPTRSVFRPSAMRQRSRQTQVHCP